jgi:chitinase
MEEELSAFCYESTVDIIPVGFMNTFPAQGNGLPGFVAGDYGCWPPPAYPYYDGPGYDLIDNPLDNALPTRCPYIQQDIPLCQQLGKKILLSLGGAAVDGNYQLTGATDGVAFAEWIWGAYGPYNQTWINIDPTTNIRPWDRGLYNTDSSNYYQIDIDGFDFDIEIAPTGKILINSMSIVAKFSRLG